jgi:hypothetical protein
MDIQNLQSKIRSSRLLSNPERTYWLENMSKMNDDQLGKLEIILTEAEELPWNQEMQQYMLLATKATQALQA